MKTLELTAALERSEVVVGESLPLRVAALNRGGQPVEIPNRLGPGEFEFVFRRLNQPGMFRVASEASALAHRSVDRTPYDMAPRDTLGGGEKADYLLDPADFLVEPLPPGDYTLAVAFGADAARLESPAVPLKVVAPRVTDLATLTMPDDGAIAIGFVHFSSAQKSVAGLSFVSGSESTRQGVYYRRLEVAAPDTIGGVALTAFDEMSRQQWVAWLQGGVLTASATENSITEHTAKTEPLGLRSAALHRIGWKDTPGTASFAVLGIDQQGRVTLALAAFSRSGPPTVRRIALDGGQMPAAWKVASRDGKLVVVTADRSGNSTRVRSQTITGDTAAAPVMLLERAAPLLALSVDALGGSPAVADVLLGPVDGKVTLFRCALEGGGQPLEFTAPLPEGPAAAAPSQWTLSGRPLAEPIFAVKQGDRLLARRFGEGHSWATLASQSAGADHLRLEPTGEHLTAIWVDPSAGVKHAIVP